MSSKVELTPKKRRAIAALLVPGTTQAQAADAAGINSRTLTRWLKDDDFQRGLADAERALLNATLRHLTSLGAKAAQCLGDALAGRCTAEQRRAACDVLRLIMQMKQAVDFDERLAELERKVGL